MSQPTGDTEGQEASAPALVNEAVVAHDETPLSATSAHGTTDSHTSPPQPQVRPTCYTCTQLAAEFRQGEIIADLEQVIRISPDNEAEVRKHAFAVIVSQDCDLAADYRARNTENGRPVMNGILLFEAFRLDNFLGGLGYNTNEKKQVRQNNNFRYHVLEEGLATDDLEGKGFPALAIDFRRYFTLAMEDIIDQLKQDARRRSRLNSPYVEHLQSRALHYLGRVALPDSN